MKRLWNIKESPKWISFKGQCSRRSLTKWSNHFCLTKLIDVGGIFFETFTWANILKEYLLAHVAVMGTKNLLKLFQEKSTIWLLSLWNVFTNANWTSIFLATEIRPRLSKCFDLDKQTEKNMAHFSKRPDTQEVTDLV